MSPWVTSHFRSVPRLLGVLAVMAAMLVQGFASPAMARPQDPLAALAAASVLCQYGHPGAGHDRSMPHRAADCALCPLCAVLGVPALLAAGPVLPRPSIVTLDPTRERPAARAPPALVASAYPRGPPPAV